MYHNPQKLLRSETYIAWLDSKLLSSGWATQQINKIKLCNMSNQRRLFDKRLNP